jgi:general secretion pathway protein F
LSFGLGAGIGLVDATDLANKAVPEGAFRNRMTEAIVALRAGKPVEQAFAGGDVLDDLDVSLLRAGQRSGALAEMFGLIAERHETSMRDKLKQVSVVVEQGAIAVVALAIGTVVISLVSTLVSVYDAIQ